MRGFSLFIHIYDILQIFHESILKERMKRVSLIIFFVLVIAYFAWLATKSTTVDESLFQRFQIAEPQLANSVILSFPLIEQTSKTNLENIPQEVRNIIPEGGSNLTFKTVQYKDGSGFFISGTIQMEEIPALTQKFGIQVTSSGWRTSMGAYHGNTIIREIENSNYQARIIFFDNSFGIFSLKKHAQ
jgi:hypothetical protein